MQKVELSDIGQNLLREFKDSDQKLVTYTMDDRGTISEDMFDAIAPPKIAFYQAIRTHIGPDALAYYPGCGANPIPVHVFGEKVIYESIDVFYFDYLRKYMSNRYGFAYWRFIQKHGPFHNLTTLLSDSLVPHFQGESFDLVIVDFGLFHRYPGFFPEIFRLTKPGGMLVTEEEFSDNHIDSKNSPIVYEDGYLQQTETILRSGYEKGTPAHNLRDLEIYLYQSDSRISLQTIENFRETYSQDYSGARVKNRSRHDLRIFHKPTSWQI